MSEPLRDRWLAFAPRIGDAGDPASLWVRLERMYASPPRSYHTLHHVGEVLHILDGVRAAAERPDEVELALWWHDAVYDARRTDNEERSAALTAIVAQELGAPDEVAERVRSLVLATRHTGEPLQGDAALIVDIDLAVLACADADYDKYAEAVRAEYRHVSDDAFGTGRAAFLEKMLARERIFRTNALAGLEPHARTNMSRELLRLRLGPPPTA
jgi:predicted metal-dependent HD superfamily phosphohydrolase